MKRKGDFYFIVWILNYKVNLFLIISSKQLSVDQITNFFGKDSPSIEPSNDDEKLKLATISDLTPESTTKTLPATKTKAENADELTPVDVRKPIEFETEKKEKPKDMVVDNGLVFTVSG